MYADFCNQFIHISRYALSFILLLFWLPGLIFRKSTLPFCERLLSNFIKMVFLIIIIGYALVALKLFEVIVLTIIFTLLSYRGFLKRNSKMNLNEMLFHVQIWFYNFVDGKSNLKETLCNWFGLKLMRIKELCKNLLKVKAYFFHTFLFVTIFGYAVYLRFYDAVKHAAPAMSDSSVTLAWVKYINNRILFHDGIYPQGFHIFMAILSKFAAIDPIYILKYTGPLDGILIVGGFYFVVLRFTGNYISAFISASVYGIFGNFILYGDWDRQVATNSQEFAFVFILPTLYFFYCYIRDSNSEYMWTAAAGTSVTGLVHSLAFVLLVLGIGVLLVITIIYKSYKPFRKVLNIFLVLVGATIISLMPILMGWILGKSFHSTSAEFLTTKSLQIIKPELTLLDYIALGCIILITLGSILDKKSGKAVFPRIFIAVFGLATFIIYYWGGVLSKSQLVASRSVDLWAIVLPCCIGIGVYMIIQLFKTQYTKYITAFFAMVLCVMIIMIGKPVPIVPYKMEYDSSIEQYLRISESLRPTKWMIVAQKEETYSLVYGKGYHMYIRDFLHKYDAGEQDLKKWTNSIAADIFIYNEKKVYKVDKNNSIYTLMSPIYERGEFENIEMERWVKKYQTIHNNISVFYEDNNFRVFHIKIPSTMIERSDKIWKISESITNGVKYND